MRPGSGNEVADGAIGPDAPAIAGRTSVAVAVALVIANASNYAFQVVTGRNLSVSEYGDLAGYMAAIAVITVATSALQTTSARTIAAGEADPHGPRYLDPMTRTTFVLALAGLALALVLSPLAASVLDFGFFPTLVLGAYVLPASLDSVAAGRLQGARRFGWLGAYAATQAVAKLAVVAVGLALGLSVASLIAAVVVSSFVVAACGRALSMRDGAVRTHALGRETRISFLALTIFWLALSMDLPIARLRFGSTEAGIYAAGAVLGKAVLWLPATIAQLAFPTLARRDDGGGGSLLRRAALLTFTIAVASVIGLATLGSWLYASLYGDRYQGAASIAWKIGLAMVPLALVNLLMFDRLSRRDTRFVLVLVVSAVAQAVALATVPASAAWFAGVLGAVGVASAAGLYWTTERTPAADEPSRAGAVSR